MQIQVSPCQAVKIKYLGPTNTKGARLKCTAQAGSKTYNYYTTNQCKPEKALELFLAEPNQKYWQSKNWVIGAIDATTWLAVSYEVKS